QGGLRGGPPLLIIEVRTVWPCTTLLRNRKEEWQTLFEFANALLAALFLAAVFDMFAALRAAPERGFGRVKAAVSGLWRQEHYLFGGWGASWRQKAGK